MSLAVPHHACSALLQRAHPPFSVSFPRTTRTGFDKSIIMFELKPREAKALSIAMSLFSKHNVALMSISSYLKPSLESSMPAQPLYLAELKGTHAPVRCLAHTEKEWFTVMRRHVSAPCTISLATPAPAQATATMPMCRRCRRSSRASANH